MNRLFPGETTVNGNPPKANFFMTHVALATGHSKLSS